MDCGKISYDTPVAALRAMTVINKAHKGITRLRGMYRHGDHVHLTRKPGNRALLAQAVTDALAELVRSRF